MNLFLVSNFLISLTSLALILILIFYGKTKIHRVWALCNITIFCWGVGTTLLAWTDKISLAALGWKIGFAAGIFIAILYYHTVYILASETIYFKNGKFLRFSYIFGVVATSLTLLKSDLVMSGFRLMFDSIYYPFATPIYSIIFMIWGSIAFFSSFELYRFMKLSQGIESVKAKYLLFAFSIGFIGGGSAHLPSWGIPIYPFGNLGVALYGLIGTYAILRYRILDLKIAVTRVSVFIVVYSIILGIPFWIGIKFLGKGPWLIPTGICAALATVGPFIYLFLQRKAENALLQEDKRIQDLLNRASMGMRTIRNLPKLLELIVDILSKSLRLENAAIYLHEPLNDEYVFKRSSDGQPINANIAKSDPLIQELEETKYPLVSEELRLSAELKAKDENLSEIIHQMGELRASMIIPMVVENILLGFIVLGVSKDKRIYSMELINVLLIVGNNAALAIENCHYFEAETRRMEEEGVRERMASLDHMASSMAHEIDNPNTVILNQADLIIEELDRDPRTSIPEEIKKDIVSSLRYIQESSVRVSGMISAILEYSRMGAGQLKPIKIYDSLASFEKLISPELKKTGVEIKKDVEENLPYILADKVQIEEIFMNLIINSLHAVKNKEGEKRVVIRVFKKDAKFIRIECSDNGYGIAPAMLNDIFLASVTTKGSVEGTGLGLYRVRKIVDKHRGKVWAESEGRDKGARFIVELPIHQGEFSDIIDEDVQRLKSKKIF